MLFKLKFMNEETDQTEVTPFLFLSSTGPLLQRDIPPDVPRPRGLLSPLERLRGRPPAGGGGRNHPLRRQRGIEEGGRLPGPLPEQGLCRVHFRQRRRRHHSQVRMRASLLVAHVHCVIVISSSCFAMAAKLDVLRQNRK